MADFVGDEPVPVDELAASFTRTLHRFIACCDRSPASASSPRPDPERFVRTPLSDGLRSDAPSSARYIAMLFGSDGYLAGSELLRSVRTGKRAADGSLTTTLLEAQVHLRGIVFDLPHVALAAESVIENAGLADRSQVVGGDFFTERIPAADVYVLAQILHDWDDERALDILRNCRSSIEDKGRLRLVEQIVPESEEPSFSKLLDLLMLVLFGGKERTAAEWGTLLHDSGFELMSITPAPGTNLIEVAPA